MCNYFYKAAFYGTIEDGVANLYLAHLSQEYHDFVYAPDGSIIAYINCAILDPRPFVECLENKER